MHFEAFNGGLWASTEVVPAMSFCCKPSITESVLLWQHMYYIYILFPLKYIYVYVCVCSLHASIAFFRIGEFWFGFYFLFLRLAWLQVIYSWYLYLFISENSKQKTEIKTKGWIFLVNLSFHIFGKHVYPNFQFAIVIKAS